LTVIVSFAMLSCALSRILALLYGYVRRGERDRR
jgi:hypothetical protein